MRLILHCDDFGLHPAVNQAVMQAADRNRLTSASLLANGPAARQAVQAARRRPQLGIGVHLNIVRGRPLSPPREVPTLVDRQGRFPGSAAVLMLRSAAGRLSETEIRREYRRQIQWVLDQGVTPTHFDGEKHTHVLLPQAVRALGGLMEEFGIRRVRTVIESPILGRLAAGGRRVSGSPVQGLKQRLVETGSRAAVRAWAPVRTPDWFFGLRVSGRLEPRTGTDLARRLLGLRLGGTLEWMFHLGTPDELSVAGWGRFFLDRQRARELALVTSPAFGQALTAGGARLISYSDL